MSGRTSPFPAAELSSIVYPPRCSGLRTKGVLMHRVTSLLRNIEQGDAQATDELVSLTYDELRRLAAELMRRILVENARWRRSRKHGGGWHRVPLDSLQVPGHEPQGERADDILAVDEVLKRFAAEDPVKAEL